jgi:hypothetical protein
MILDFANGVAHAVGGVFDQEPFGIPQPPGNPAIKRSNVIIGQAFGTFLRVNSDDCLNVREAPGLDADVIDCIARNALVHDMGESRMTDGIEWKRIRLLDGREGWASAEFLNLD